MLVVCCKGTRYNKYLQPLHNSFYTCTWSAVSFTHSMKVATSAANTGSTETVKWEMENYSWLVRGSSRWKKSALWVQNLSTKAHNVLFVNCYNVLLMVQIHTVGPVLIARI